MPRPARDTAAGMFHVFTHCVWAVPAYFRDDIDRVSFLRYLARVTERARWTCLSFCLMTTHYHLIVEVEDGVLPPAMKSLNCAYAREFNRRHALKGHTQYRRYGSRRILDDTDLLDTFAYVANNPVAACLCRSPVEWSWSSYAGTVGYGERQSFVDDARVLGCFRWPKVDPRAALRQHVENL